MSDEFETSLAPVAPYDQGAPRINAPAMFGARKQSAFFLPLPVTGEQPLSFEASGLPPGLEIDRPTGIITGKCPNDCRAAVIVSVNNRLGNHSRAIKIVIGDNIALTPPMGWNSWNCWAEHIAAEKIMVAADAMVASGLAAHGYSYINIDTGWQGERGGKYNAIQGNANFPDMAGLCAHIHRKGLRAGIYSTPWVKSYCSAGEGFTGGSSGPSSGTQSPYYAGVQQKKYIGVITYEKEDSAQWAEWGFDYLKYDWFVNDVPSTERIAVALRASGRDIVLSLSNNAPFGLAAEWVRLANCWRIAGDITDTWESICYDGFGQEKWMPYAGPGHWNDPDMLVVGQIGWGKPRECRLTRDEQITHLSLWTLLSAPLLIGCDLTRMDDLTLRLLCNDEVIAVNQDILGRQACCVKDARLTDTRGNLRSHETIYAKILDKGDFAVGLFNRGPEPAIVRLNWSDIDITGECKVRDVWGRKDIGIFNGSFEMGVRAHGAQLILLSK